MIPIVAAESATQLGAEVRGAVLVVGSHGGVVAAWLSASAGARAVILNDAGVGKDAAGIAGLDYLARIGTAAATVAHTSARIGDGADALERGVISHSNALATALGVVAGMSCRAAAERLRGSAPAHAAPPPYSEGRYLLRPGAVEVWGLDSIGKLVPEDAGRVLVIGSHAALHGGRPDSALGVAARGAVFHDAGVGAAGVTRLPVLAARGVPAAAVDGMTARIGDARSLWETGVIAHLNAPALASGARVGMSAREFAVLAAGRA